MTEIPQINITNNNCSDDSQQDFNSDNLHIHGVTGLFSTKGQESFEDDAPLLESHLPAFPSGTARRGSSLSMSLHHSPRLIQRRKFSFPAALPSGLLSIEPGGSARRRFSNVSDVVTRKLSNTIGWRSAVPCRDIVTVGKSLCCQYIRSRLKRSGYLNKKCGLQRLRSAVSLSGGTVFREVFPELLALGMELERVHPKVYINVVRQASSAPGGRLTSDKEAGAVLTAVSRELLKQILFQDVTWAKVVSLYAVAGGLAVDCVRQGHYDYLASIVEAMEEILEDELASWIHDKGGWGSLSTLVKPQTSEWPSPRILVFTTSVASFVFLLVLVVRFIGLSTFI